MNYLEDLDKNMKLADKFLASLEKAARENWTTAYDISTNDLRVLLKNVRFCVECAKREREKLGPEKKFKCSGGCTRPGQFAQFSEINKRIQFFTRLIHWREGRDGPKQSI